MITKLTVVLILMINLSGFAQKAIQMTGDNSYLNREFVKNNEKFTFAILGDKTTGGVLNWPIFDRAVAEINLLQPDFVIMVGDMIQGTVRDTAILNRMWNEFNEHAEKLDVPLYLLPGNHDISNDVMYDYWNDKIGLRYYSFIHNNSLFILMNTEEFKKTKDGEFGKDQIEFVKQELGKYKDVNQTFIFFHRPVWNERDAKHGGYQEWKEIRSLLENRDATIFAGHWHNLEFNKIGGSRYIVLSSTGGELKEKALTELGYFHHYTLVTVDKDTSTISYVKPGSIYREDIANREFINKFNSLVKIDSKMKVTGSDITVESNFEINNLLNKNIGYTLKIKYHDNPSWKFEDVNFTGNIEPEKMVSHNFTGTSSIKNSLPFPKIEYSLDLGDDLVETKMISFTPRNDGRWRYPENVVVIGGFDLGITKKPRTKEDIKDLQISDEVTYEMDQEYISEKLENNYDWQNADVVSGEVGMDKYFENNNFAFGYISFIINTDKDGRTLAALRPDNYAQFYLNGEAILKGFPFKGVPDDPYMFYMDLKEGENHVLIKTADFYGSWYIDFKILDPQNNYEFLTK